MLRTSEFILNFVLNSCWQIAAIVAVAALASWLLRNGPARYRHVLWIVALVGCLIVPLLTATHVVPTWNSTEPSAVAPGPVNSSGPQEDLNVDHIGTRRTRTVTTTPRIVLFLVFAYALFILVRAIRLARFWRRKERLCKTATRTGLGPEVSVAATRCRELLGIRDVTVTRSTEARAPYTIGARHPLIVLPDAYCSTVDEAKLLSVIGHEMAHVARRDFLTNLICELLSLPISFHPLTYLLKREIDRTRELACDELVTRRVLAPKVYARSLLWAADVTRQYSSQAFMLSIFDGRILEERIVRLMKHDTRVGARFARALMFAAMTVLCLSALSLSMFAVELQTQVHAAVTQSILTSTTAAVQDRVAAVRESRNEAQTSRTPQDDRAASACNAARSGDTEAIPLLIAMLGDDSRSQLVKCWDTSRWSPALETFKHPSPGEQAALALASFGRPAFTPLTNQLDSSNATVRRNAAWAIGELTNMAPGERANAVPQLITLLGDSDEWVRMAAARALGELRDERALSKLVATLSDDDWRVRELSTWALSEMKDARAVTALCNVLLADTRVEVRRGAAEALGEINSADALPTLKQALNDKEPSVSAKAAWAISEIEG
ncbi:MAG TPA: M56 family metallopeptidase [Pyrinomonadaceae bacterium]|jgi:beta-lactamase regulating signal transducer with metallopeptidase domain